MTDRQRTDDSTVLPTMEDLRQTMRSRRDVLAGTGAVIGAGLVGTAATAQEDDAAGNQPAEIPPQFDQPDTDVDVLNYALTLEYLEDAFYDAGLEQFGGDELASASALEVPADLLVTFFEDISAQEQSHTEQLARVIETLGATPAEPPEFEFDLDAASAFIETAQVLENTGVAAYAGVAPRIESPDILSAALSIHSVEARHAAVLNALVGESPFPNAYDPALPIPDVLSAIQPFMAEEMEEPPGEETDTPGDETETEVPGDETETEVPGDETETEVPGDETETEVPGDEESG
ncbi:ferritin-like domain-containing protein [Halomicrobium sp. IBSBa]|uniref:ferritin-like domain-containing protein n=1 Tax=Halomicrobium sp. IBSBa TaxID=2778916 RepID=UPI001FC99EFB|nr:ferritin-like domain-containing protein [Halomicrobium sp. IBSBa]